MKNIGDLFYLKIVKMSLGSIIGIFLKHNIDLSKDATLAYLKQRTALKIMAQLGLKHDVCT